MSPQWVASGATVGGGVRIRASVSASLPSDVNVVTAEKAACTEKTDTTSLYCRRLKDITGVPRSSQCFEYKERLDER